MADDFDDIPTAWIPLRDGTKLAARLWLPKGDKPVPAVLEYLPYRRRDVTAARDASTYPAFAAMGIAGVRVDLRGTGDSGGHFDDEYSETELSDAEAVIAWIAAQPWCDGNVGMMGISWGGFNALQVAARRPEALKAIISIASTVDRFGDDIHYKGGAQMSANLYWATQMLGRAALPQDAAVVGDGWRAAWLKRLEGLPALIFPWLKHQRRDDYWRHGSICEDFSALTAPALMIAGWADGYRNAPWDARAELGDGARSITGPWVHLYPHFAVPEPKLDFLAEAERWWGKHLLGRDTGAEDLPPHRMYLSEAVRPDASRRTEPGRWIAVDPASARQDVLHLHPGRLSPVPSTSVVEQIVHTPLDCGCDGGEFFTQGADTDLPGDQRADDGMSLCFETEELEAPLDIIGRPELQVPVTLDAAQGNLIARLVDAHPDGVAHRISMAVLNLSHRHGSAAPVPMTPGLAEPVTLRFDATGYRILPGHKLRLAISTSYFPMILPAPTDVAACLGIGPEARLALPSAAYHVIDMAKGADTRPDFPRASPASAVRSFSRDRASGRVSVTVTDSTGEMRHPDHGLVWCDDRHSTWRITRGDPLSLEGEETCSGRRERDGLRTDVIATGRLRVTAKEWIVEARIEAREDGHMVFERNWSERIARDHM